MRSPVWRTKGPAAGCNRAPRSATARASVVLPRPGGPASSVWAAASPLILAAFTAVRSALTVAFCPITSSRRVGRGWHIVPTCVSPAGPADSIASASSADSGRPGRSS